jgi:hypothetical protein
MIDAIVCVLRSGSTDYTPEYVERLMHSVRQYEIERICLTDFKGYKFENCDNASLRFNYPGWWSKIELFDHPALKNKSVLYFDLDTIIRSDIKSILEYDHKFTMLKGFMRELPASGVIAFNGDYSHLSHMFSMQITNQYKTIHRLGDQAYIRENVRRKIDLFQDIFPDMFSSFKVDSKEVITKSSVVCFHGRPRPHEVNWNPLCKHRLKLSTM